MLENESWILTKRNNIMMKRINNFKHKHFVFIKDKVIGVVSNS